MHIYVTRPNMSLDEVFDARGKLSSFPTDSRRHPSHRCFSPLNLSVLSFTPALHLPNTASCSRESIPFFPCFSRVAANGDSRAESYTRFSADTRLMPSLLDGLGSPGQATRTGRDKLLLGVNERYSIQLPEGPDAVCIYCGTP